MAKVPDNIWNSDCKYCCFRKSTCNVCSENKYDSPCVLGKYGRLDENSKVYMDDGTLISILKYNKDHCHSFRPRDQYGMCGTCYYFNSFEDDTDNLNDLYCVNNCGSLNRKDMYPGIVLNNIYHSSESWNYVFFTCERYKVNLNFKHSLLNKALDGYIPRNFNPVTWEPCENENSKEWKALLEERNSQLKEKDLFEKLSRGHCRRKVKE